MKKVHDAPERRGPSRAIASCGLQAMLLVVRAGILDDEGFQVSAFIKSLAFRRVLYVRAPRGRDTEAFLYAFLTFFIARRAARAGQRGEDGRGIEAIRSEARPPVNCAAGAVVGAGSFSSASRS